jgi:pentatricopeptide repeat protein
MLVARLQHLTGWLRQASQAQGYRACAPPGGTSHHPPMPAQRCDPPPCIRACRALVSSLTRGGKLETAFDALDWMHDDGVQGNAIVYQTLINACLEADEWDKVGAVCG